MPTHPSESDFALLQRRSRIDGEQRSVIAIIGGYPARVVGLLLDLLFLEHPKKWTASARLTRHSESTGWRQRVAIAIRTALLDNIDPNGVHRG